MRKEKADKLVYERECLQSGFRYIAGADEVGRGPLAGPVVCAAVIMPLEGSFLLEGVDDSKKLSAKRREELAELIYKTAIGVSVAETSAERIDEINILQATRECMKKAVLGLPVTPDIVLTDGNMTLDISFPQRSIVKGDALSYSIGAASIVAKVYRDALMDEYAKKYPEYGFERHKGYGTAAHIAAIKEFGICPIHRKTFTKKF